MAFTTSEIISYAKISQYLCAVEIMKKGLYAGGIDIQLPNKIYNIRKSVEYWYDLDSTDTTLVATGNYLQAICGKYFLQAQAVEGVAGAIAVIHALSAPDPEEFVVAASGTFMVDGESTKTITDYIGYNLIFIRNNINQSTVDIGGGTSYFSWDRDSGSFFCSPAAITSELFQLIPV